MRYLFSLSCFFLIFEISLAQKPAGHTYLPIWVSSTTAQKEKALDDGYRGFIFNYIPSENEFRELNNYPDTLYIFLPNSTLGSQPNNLNKFNKLKIFDNFKIKKDLRWLKTPDLANKLSLDDRAILLELSDTTDRKFLNFVLDSVGLVPQFIVQPGNKAIPDSLGRVYEAVVAYNQRPLAEVKYKEFPKLTASSRFQTHAATLSPYKRGYYFSPDIFNFTDRNNKNPSPKIFHAFKYGLTEKLRFSFPFSGNTTGRIKPSDKLKTTQLAFATDPEKGKVASFNGMDSYIYLKSESIEDTRELSITAWIRPNEVNGSYSLLGKGQAYSAKIYWGRLQFTTPGIKDHATSSRVIQKNKWQHIAYSFIPGDQINFYLNGKLIERVEGSKINPTAHAILIGSNLWGQHYNGLMSDLHLWDRALSDAEIKQVYQYGIDSENQTHTSALLWICGALFLLLLPIFLFYHIYWKKTNNTLPTPEGAPTTSKNTIEFLNGFKIYTAEHGDISNKFSPKHKALLTLLLYYSIKNEGISTKRLSDILWPAFSAEKQKNNRSTQLKKLRNTLQEYKLGAIEYEGKKWIFIGSNDFFIDIFELNNVIPHFLNRKIEAPQITGQQTIAFAKILLKGPLLPNTDAEWMDAIKAEFNDRCLELLSTHVDLVPQGQKLLVYDAMLIIDPLFETAVESKAKVFR